MLDHMKFHSVSAVIEYFYTAEFNSGLGGLNGGGRLDSVSGMKSSLRHYKFGREERRVYPNNGGRANPRKISTAKLAAAQHGDRERERV